MTVADYVSEVKTLSCLHIHKELYQEDRAYTQTVISGWAVMTVGRLKWNKGYCWHTSMWKTCALHDWWQSLAVACALLAACVVFICQQTKLSKTEKVPWPNCTKAHIIYMVNSFATFLVVQISFCSIEVIMIFHGTVHSRNSFWICMRIISHSGFIFL